MNIIIVEDEEIMLKQMRRMVKQAAPDNEPACFTTAKDAYAYALEHPVDVAFLDIQMGDVNGIELAKALCKLKPDVNLIFVTGHPEYMGEAFKLYASGFVTKPLRAERIKRELENLRHKPAAPQPRLPDSIGAFTFDHDHGRVYRGEKDLKLKPMEYKLLRSLAAAAGEYLRPEELQANASGETEGNYLPTLYVHMSGLRKKLKLDDPGAGIEIEHSRGKGYRLAVKMLVR